MAAVVETGFEEHLVQVSDTAFASEGWAGWHHGEDRRQFLPS
jgi:hypothetical protein